MEKRLVEWAKRRSKKSEGKGLLLEGGKLIREALTAGLRLRAAWFTVDAADNEPNIIDGLRLTGCPFRPVNARVMKTLSDLDTPPGIVAAADQPLLPLKRPEESFKLIVALFGAQDPGNVGGVVRTADYFGADEVWMDNQSTDPYSPKALRGSMGAAFRLPIFRGDVAGRIARFKERGAVVWGSVAHGSAVDSLPQARRMILMIGSESSGLGESELRLADRLVKIDGAERSESLNLGVAAGILIFQALHIVKRPRV